MAKGHYLNYIDGKWVGAKSSKTFPNINPADHTDTIGKFPASDSRDVAAAVDAAQRHFDSWRKVPAPRRGEILFKAREIMMQEKEQLARLMTREMGKGLKEARGDVQEGIDTATYYAAEGRRLVGQTAPSELVNKFCMTLRDPIGVCGLITPWNFPLAIPTWKIFPALICGNTIVFKPASDTPAMAHKLVEIMEEAGLPPGVLNLVHGFGKDVGGAIVGHPGIKLVSFTGSAETGRFIAESCGKNLKRYSLEMGGKNAQIVMDDADMNLAVEGALWGGFGTTGQRCTATSRLIVHEKVHDTFVHDLLGRAKAIHIGYGLDAATDMGPLINDAAREKVHRYVGIGKKEKAKLVLGGDYYAEGACKKGSFYSPTVFVGVKSSMRIAQEQVFGPVVVVLKVKSFEEAIDVLNDTPYGLSSSLYTRDVNRAFTAIRDIQAGITYINGPTIGAEVHLPFGGVKNTGNGHREAGQTALDIFSEWKTVFVDYSGKLQKAQIDAD